MASECCCKYSDLNQENTFGKKYCFKCQNAEIISEDARYCSCCGAPLAILGLPLAGQITDRISSQNNERKYKVRLFNAGSVPIEVSFNTRSLPSNSIKIEPAGKITLKSDYPGIIDLKEGMKNIFKNTSIEKLDGKDLLSYQDFTITIYKELIDLAKTSFVEIPIETNAVTTNQLNINYSKKKYLAIVSKGDNNSNDEDDKKDKKKSNGDDDNELFSIEVKNSSYSLKEYDDYGIPKSLELDSNYTCKNKSEKSIKLNITPQNENDIISRYQGFPVHGRQAVNLHLTIDSNKFIKYPNNTSEDSLHKNYKTELTFSTINPSSKEKNDILQTKRDFNVIGDLDYKIAICSLNNLINNNTSSQQCQTINFNRLLPRQVRMEEVIIKFDFNKNQSEVLEPLKIENIEFSNDFVKITNIEKLKNHDFSKIHEYKLNLIFSTRWVKSHKYYYFEGDNIISGKILLTTNLLSKKKIAIEWEATVVGLAGRDKDEENILALDFGTENSCVAIFNENDSEPMVAKPFEILNINDEKGIIPSILLFMDKEVFAVGEKANRIVKEERDKAENAVLSIKRCITGKDREFFYKNYNTVEIASLMMEQMILGAINMTECYPKHVVLTIPANFWGPLRDKIKEAFQKAWDGEPTFIDEPTAAAIYFMQRRRELFNKNRDGNFENYILVFDFGGGTLDVSILKYSSTNGEIVLEPIIARGDNEMGGIDIDYEMIKCLSQHYTDENVRRIISSPKKEFDNQIKKAIKDNYKHAWAARFNLSENAKKLKIELSSQNEGCIDLPSIEELNVQPINNLKISREEFEGMIKTKLNKAKAFVGRCVAAAKLKQEQIDYVLLTGQSSKIPAVAKMLEDIFKGKQIIKAESAESKTCVALGAAWEKRFDIHSKDFKVNGLTKTSYRYGYMETKSNDHERFYELIDNGVEFTSETKPREIEKIKSLEIVQYEGIKNDDCGDMIKLGERENTGITKLGTIDLTQIEPKENGKYDLRLKFDNSNNAKILAEINGKDVEIKYNEKNDTSPYI